MEIKIDDGWILAEVGGAVVASADRSDDGWFVNVFSSAALSREQALSVLRFAEPLAATNAEGRLQGTRRQESPHD